MNLLAVAAALWAAGTWALGSVFFARALAPEAGPERPSPLAANTFKNVVSFACFGALLLALGGDWPAPRAAALLVASGVLGFLLGDTLYLAAIPRCGIQVAATVALLYVPLAAGLDLLLYGARLAAVQVAGMALTMLGVGLVVAGHAGPSRGPARAPAEVRRGVLLSLGVVVVIACAVVLGHGESAQAGLAPMGALRLGGGALAALPLGLALGPRGQGAPVVGAGSARGIGASLRTTFAPFLTRRARPRALLAATALAVAGLLPYHFALQTLPGGVGAILFATTPLFTLLLGRLSGERAGAQAVLGTLVGFTGVGLVVLGGR